MTIPIDFLETEFRSSFFVSEKRKKIWSVELRLLSKFIEVCKRHNLRYFLNGGTLLGAARHGGFIPWDDDIDVMMPRLDYEQLCLVASKEFEEPFFFQTSLTEKEFFRSHAQLRDSRSTGCIIEDRTKEINRGIFIDIFPIDGVPEGYFRQLVFKFSLVIFKKFFILTISKEPQDLNFVLRFLRQLARLVYRIVPYHTLFIYYQKIQSRYSDTDTKLVGEISLKFRKEAIWNKEWFDDFTLLPFEGSMLPVPYQYQKVLEVQFGKDWNSCPSLSEIKRFPSFHGDVIFEPDIPYSEYFKNL